MKLSGFPHLPKSSERGFALVATLSMLVLLVVLALGMMSLSTVTLRSSGRDKAALRAQSNARLALQLAVGRLQELAGPDARVTASSAITGEEVKRKHLTGVWEGWKWDGKGSAPDWDEEKSSRFKGWLVSSNNEALAKQETFPQELPAGDSVTLLGEARDPEDRVDAEVVSLESTRGRKKEGFAWAVFDESQKASLSLSAEPVTTTYATKLDRLSAAHELGFDAVKAFDWKALAEKKDERSVAISRAQSQFLGLEKEAISFHDLTPGSLGLLTNVAEGGFASDLSRLFDQDTLPSDFASRFLYSGQDVPLFPPPTRFSGANPLPSPDPSWALLHSHYRTYTKLSGGAQPEVVASTATIEPRSVPKKTMSSAEILRNPAFNQQQIAPVIAKAQFVFSLTFGYNKDTLDNMWANSSARPSPQSLRDTYITWLVIDPVITLWNPYNVPVRFTSATVELYRIPLAFRIYKNDKLISTNYTRLTDAHTVENFKDRQNRFYLLNLLPERGQTSMVLQPGEHVVFSGQEWTLHGGHQYNTDGLTMRPGFFPPAGANSSPYVGGVTTQNLFVDDTGKSSGKDYGKTIRTVAVKGGDRIQVDVKPEHAEADDLEETGGKEITGLLKYYIGTGASKELLGGIELDYGDKEKEFLAEYDRNDLPTIIVSSDIPKGPTGGLTAAEQALRWKEPFLISTFQQKTERDSRFPSRSWINNAPGNFYASAGLDQTEDFAHQQFEFKWEPMMDWPPDSPTIEISNERNRGFGGSGIYAQSGTEFAAFTSIPLEPAHSLGQLSHAPLNVGGQLPLTSRIVGNSFAPPLISADKAIESAGGRVYLDHSYLANNALFDSTFLSTVADHPAVSGNRERSASSLLNDFFKERKALPNSRFQPYLVGKTADEVINTALTDSDAYRGFAANLLVEAPFNVNSTSVAAWQAVLASNFNKPVPLANGSVDEGSGVPVVRNAPTVGESYEQTSGASTDSAKWTGYRRLTDDQIEKLAIEVVKEVKKRGPFQSLAEFVNRRPGRGELARQGALQSAIEQAGINETVLDPGYHFTATTGANANAGSGNTADGAPGVITQADLLTPILPQLTARGDTFVIRAYGEAWDDEGKKVRAWCEATVQRFPEYVDASVKPEEAPTSLTNQTFGRRFQVVSFRWLNRSEI